MAGIESMSTRINGGAASGAADRRAQRRVRGAFARPPEQANENFIPTPEALATLIDGAVTALRGGIYWNRGSMLNLLV